LKIVLHFRKENESVLEHTRCKILRIPVNQRRSSTSMKTHFFNSNRFLPQLTQTICFKKARTTLNLTTKKPARPWNTPTSRDTTSPDAPLFSPTPEQLLKAPHAPFEPRKLSCPIWYLEPQTALLKLPHDSASPHIDPSSSHTVPRVHSPTHTHA